MSRQISLIAVALALCGLAAGAAAFFPRPPAPLRWSDPATWPGGRIPRAGEVATLPAGRTVLLDTDPPPLARVEVLGSGTALVFDDGADRHLRAGDIMVGGEGAGLCVGSEQHPFRHRATITLTGGGPKAGRMLAVSGTGARLELHGEPGRASWTCLGDTAPAGAQSLTLASPAAGWRVGDRLVVAPSGFDAHEAEEVGVAAVSPDRRRVTLDRPLRFRHWGRVTARGVDERAEVGLLSRNVAVEGEPGRGGCVMVMGADAGARLSGTEFRHLGKLGKKGNYPVHFHLVGNAAGSYVRDCAIHHGLNRWLTIHGTRGLVARGNVGYDTVGHGFFLEDADETGNTLSGNLGVLVRAPDPKRAVLRSDLRPAVFWVSNPDNVLTGNAAAGSEYYGFWYDLPTRPTGVAATDPARSKLRPRRTRLGGFADNAAHSCEHDGLFVDNAENPPGVYGAPTYDPPVPAGATFSRLTAYKCRRRGAWLRGSRLRLDGARLADNCIGATLACSLSEMSGSLVVGETENRTGAPKPDEPGAPLCGFEFYDGLVTVTGTTFADFTPLPGRPASAFGVLRFSHYFVDPRNAASGVRLLDANAFHWERRPTTGNPDLSGDGYRTAVFVDADGSVTGRAGARVVAGEPALYKGAAGHDACTFRPEWNAAVCDGEKAGFARLFIDDRDAAPGGVGPVRLWPAGRPRDALRLWGVPREGENASFQANVRTGVAYAVAYEGRAAGPPQRLRLTLRHAARAGESVTVTLPSAAPSVRAARVTPGSTWQRDPRTGAVTVRLVAPAPDTPAVVEITQ